MRQLAVGVKDCAVRSQGGGPFVDGLHQDAVGMVGPFQGIDPFPFGPGDHQGVHLAVADGPQGFFRFLQTGAEVGQLFQEFLLGCHAVTFCQRL